MSLILHCGADAITRDQLAVSPVPAPRGSKHVTRPFIEDVELVTDYLGSEGVRIDNEAYGLAFDKEGLPSKFFGLLEVTIPGLGGDEYGLMIGLRGSYDQSLARGLAVGSRVFVCDNLAFSGEVEIKTKQTTNIGRRLPEELRRACASVPSLVDAQSRRFDAYRNTGLRPRVGDAAVIELVRRGVVNPSQVGKVIAEWDQPSHIEHAEQGHSAWRLHNAVTEAIKPTGDRAAVPQAWGRTRELTKFLDEVSGIDALGVVA